MESISSNSPPPDHDRDRYHRLNHPLWPPQPIADRIDRATSHHLLLLHRHESSFFVLGATGNVYTVTLSSTPTCTCPDRTAPCKHILFVLIRVLGVSLEDSCLRRRTLRPCRLQRLLTTPSSEEVLAGPGLRERFHRLFFQARQDNSSATTSLEVHVEDGETCPICLDNLTEGLGDGRLVACRTCRNPVHEECLLRWKRSRGRRPAICVICRGRWRVRAEQENRYVNLGAHVSEDDNREDDNGSHCGGHQ